MRAFYEKLATCRELLVRVPLCFVFSSSTFSYILCENLVSERVHINNKNELNWIARRVTYIILTSNQRCQPVVFLFFEFIFLSLCHTYIYMFVL